MKLEPGDGRVQREILHSTKSMANPTNAARAQSYYEEHLRPISTRFKNATDPQ